MIFTLDICRAENGDCLLLHFGSQTDPGLAVIDGGPPTVYARSLKPRLLQVRKARGLDAGTPLPLDLVMVSHVDDDHIRGCLDLTRDLSGAVGPPAFRMLSLWHNSFAGILDRDTGPLTSSVAAQFGSAALEGHLAEDAALEFSEGNESVHDALKVLASIEQGQRLRSDAEKLGAVLNAEFDGELILAGKKSVSVGGGLSFVAGPMKPELTALRKKHDEWVKTQKNKKAPAALAAYADRSVANLSSLVVLARSGTKSILLTGDARGDKILSGMELAGALKKKGSIHVDVFKVPHHGSANNIDRDLFERITADHYVFSGNGEFGNPERETLEMLLGARGKEPMEIHLTYPVEDIDKARKEEWERQRAQEIKRAEAGGQSQPREDWSAEKHGLAAFFDGAGLDAKQKIRVSDAKMPHAIDLMDPLGF